MTQVTSHPAGRWCWMELATTDPDGAKAFYGELFGWTFFDTPAGPDMVYTFVRLHGDDVGALYAQVAEQREEGVPPHWLPYVATDDVDASAEAAREGGAEVIGPDEVGEAGKTAWITDPQGARLALWWAGKHPGATRVGEPGALCWVELRTTDVDAAADFYGRLCGWGRRDSSADSPGGGQYVEWVDGDDAFAGMMPIGDDWGPVPPHWAIYLMVEDADATAARVTELGGEVTIPPMDIPGVGRFAGVADPQGAQFLVIRLDEQQG
ncbi:MAG TPA: VOC family protein [Thermoanaerobaculia bacterium]|nr:VOC family protein [Thermoanaerobaculia bacterium]